ncbi:MAG: hypothetical protein MUC83_09375, partial [Pirellula sp.]|nr:hypothetical protein [Pirellula sp.]
VRVNSYAHVSDSILFEGVEVGRNAVVRNAIVDKNVRIPSGMQIGVDPDLDRARGFTVSPRGIVTVAKTEDLSLFDRITHRDQLSNATLHATGHTSPHSTHLGKSPDKIVKSESLFRERE